MTCEVFKVGKIYHYRFQVRPFKRIQRSTKERNRPRAQKVADQAYADAVLRSNGGAPIPTLRELIGLWQQLRGPVASQSYRDSVDLLARRHLYELGDLRIDALDTKRIETARNAHLKGRAIASVNHWLSLLKMLVRWAMTLKMLPALPWSVPRLRAQKKPRAMLPTASTAEWIAAVDAYCKRRPLVPTAVRLMYGIGLREEEAATARWEWIDWERNTYTPGKTKGREAVALPLPIWLVEHLRARRKECGLIAPHRTGRAMRSGYAARAMAHANSVCGLQGVTPHRLRGTYATQLSEDGVPIQTIQMMLRHKDSATTMSYLEVDMERGARAQENIAQRSGMAGRENGEGQDANSHADSCAG